MALITGLGLFVVTILAAVLSSIVAAEIRAWSPSIIRGLIKFAVARLPENQRERFKEEWQSHVNDVPGDVVKFFVAAGFVIAACNVALNDRRNRVLKGWEDLLAQLDESHSAMTTVVNLIQNDQTLSSREDLSSLVNSLRSGIRESQENSSQLATHYEALASAIGSQTLVKSLWYTLVLSVRRRKSRDRILQGAKRISEMGALIVKRVEERRKGLGR